MKNSSVIQIDWLHIVVASQVNGEPHMNIWGVNKYKLQGSAIIYKVKVYNNNNKNVNINKIEVRFKANCRPARVNWTGGSFDWKILTNAKKPYRANMQGIPTKWFNSSRN